MDFNAWVVVGCFIGLFVLIGLGVPIFIGILASAMVGTFLIGGATLTLHQFSTGPYNITASFNFAVVPLFILMSILAAECGIAESSYIALTKWLGRFPGGLLIATTAAATIFGACCGMGLAANAVFAKVSLPSLDKQGYDKSISTGLISLTAALSALIPPSIPVVIFCILLNESIGRALVGGIVPGLLLCLLMMLVVLVIAILKPRKMPRSTEIVSWKEKFASLFLTAPMLLVVAIVIGGMYLGVFAPTVAGAIGSAGILIIALARKVKLRNITHSFYEAVLLNAQLYPFVIGGYLFARMVNISNISTTLVNAIGAANLHPALLMFAIVIFYLIIGCIMDFFSMAIITMPLVFPLLMNAGYDPIVCIIIVVLLGAIAGLTPPVGMAVFVVAGVARIKPEVVFRGIIPFFATSLLLIVIITIFPQIVTWLPDLFYGALA